MVGEAERRSDRVSPWLSPNPLDKQPEQTVYAPPTSERLKAASAGHRSSLAGWLALTLLRNTRRGTRRTAVRPGTLSQRAPCLYIQALEVVHLLFAIAFDLLFISGFFKISLFLLLFFPKMLSMLPLEPYFVLR